MNELIMVVDDDPGILALVDVMLRKHAFTVLKANGAYEALKYLDSVTPSVIVLDVMMPDMNGIELCEQIRTRPQTTVTPIIMLSARSDSRSVASAMQVGANSYISKTAVYHELVAQIRNVLDSKARNGR